MAKASLLAKLGLDSKAFSRGLQVAQKKAKGFSSRIGKLFSGLGVQLGAVGFALATKQILALGISAEETASKFKAVFKTATEEMNAELLKLQETIPSTKQEMQNALATFAQMGTAFGMNAEAGKEFSIQMVKIAGDLASFHNLPIEQAFQKIRAGITGEAEPLKALGIVINENILKREAQILGIAKEGEALNALGKALAVQSVLIRDMGDANGDASVTATSTANQLKFMRAEIIDTATAIGADLTPTILDGITMLQRFATFAIKAKDAIGEFVGRQIFMGGKSDLAFLAELELKAEGAFDALKGGRGLQDRQKLIQERIDKLREEAKTRAELAEEEKERIEEERRLEEERVELLNERLRTTEDLQGELAKQIEEETDPRRKKALEDRMASLKRQVEMLQELNKIFTQNNKKQEESKDLSAEEEEIKSKTLDLEMAKLTSNLKLIDQEEEHLKILRKALQLQKDFNLSKDKAVELARELNEAEKREERARKAKEAGVGKIREKDLAKVVNEIRRETGEGGRKDYFKRVRGRGGEVGFQEFRDGRKFGEVLSPEEMRKILADLATDEDTKTEEQLQKIIEIIQGRITNES